MDDFEPPAKRPSNSFSNVGADDYFALEKRILDKVGEFVPPPQKGDFGWYYIKYHNALLDPKIRRQVKEDLGLSRWPTGFTNGDLYDAMKRTLNKGVRKAIPEDMDWEDFRQRWSKGRF